MNGLACENTPAGNTSFKSPTRSMIVSRPPSVRKLAAPDYVAAIFIDILDHAGDERKPLQESFRQWRAGGKEGVA